MKKQSEFIGTSSISMMSDVAAGNVVSTGGSDYNTECHNYCKCKNGLTGGRFKVLLCLLFVVGIALSSFSLSAGNSVSFRGTCKSCDPPLEGTYTYDYYPDGTKRTTFVGDDDKTTRQYPGHKTSLIATGNGPDFGLAFDDGNFVLETSYSLTAFAFSFDDDDNPADSLPVAIDSLQTLNFTIPLDNIKTITFKDNLNDEIMFTIDLATCFNIVPEINWENFNVEDHYQVAVSQNLLNFTTDLDSVHIKIVELPTGNQITNYIDASTGAVSIDISNLTPGCIYTLELSSLIDGEMLSTATRNFCKE